MTSSKMEAEARYKSRVIKQCKIDLNRNTDGDIIVWLEGKDNRQGYIKRLIREDMARRKSIQYDGAQMPDTLPLREHIGMQDNE